MENEEYKIVDLDCLYSFTENSKVKEADGIAYAMFLRRSSYTLPILFSSYDKLETILERKDSRIVQAIGHGFIEKPFDVKDIEDAISLISPLNEIQLADIKHNFSGIKSALTEGYHLFKNRLRNILEQNESATDQQNQAGVEKITELINEFKKELLKNYPSITKLHVEFDRIARLFDGSNINTAKQIVNLPDTSLANEIPSEEEKVEEEKKEHPWQLLLLDDMQDELASLKNVLSRKGISCHTATTVAEAKEIIKNDVNNFITVAISDYRLFELSEAGTPTSKMQPEQGYDFLIWLAKQNKFTVGITLSGLDSEFLSECARENSFLISPYSKNDLVEERKLEKLIKYITTIGNQQLEVILHKPKGEAWLNDIIKQDKKNGKISTHSEKLISYYCYHRNHSNYLIYEEEISTTAEKIARELEFNLIKEQSFTLDSLISIKGNCTKNLPKDLEAGYATFRVKLLQRRIAYYLLFRYLEQYPIFSLLLYGKVESELLSKPRKKRDVATKGKRHGEKEDISAYKKIVNRLKPVGNFLAINAMSDIPQNLLVEELIFLEKRMGLAVREIGAVMDQSYSYINEYLSPYIKSEIELRILLNGEKKSYLVEKNGELLLCTLSLRECSIVAEKIYKYFKSKNQITIAEKIKNDILDLLYKVNSLIPPRIKDSLVLEESIRNGGELNTKKMIKKHFIRITDSFIDRLNQLK